MERIKAILFSATGMKIINVLFFLSAFIRNSGIIFAAYFVWVLYLVAAIRNTGDKTLKTAYLVMTIYAVMMIAVNGYFLWLHWN